MIQNAGLSNQNQYGAINKLGMTSEGRVAYQVVTPDGQVAGKLSIAPNDCDRFERSYNDIMEAAPKLEKYMQTHTEADLKKAQKKGRWITGIGAFVGGIIPAVLIKKPDKLIIKLLGTLAGTIAGLYAGASIAKKVTIPPGAEQMSRASQEMSKLDIKPLQ